MFRTSAPEQPITLEDYEAELSRRRAALGAVDMPRNAGDRRTESKKALLRAIKEAGGTW